MKTPSINSSLPLFVFLVIILSCFCPSHSESQRDFHQCLNNSGISGLIYTPSNSSYLSILNSTIQNLRFTSPSTLKPFIIVTPNYEHQIQAIVLCSKEHGIRIKIRSGGHDWEGLSYTSQVPFVIIDLFNLNKVAIDVKQKTAWVEAGATLGRLYYEISEASTTLAFPAGVWATVGVGGFLSGGGYGPLLRKYGIGADNVIDARMIDVNGKILDRKSMGKELFWAIRGGGGGNFGIVTAWKLKLVSVPPVVTIFSINRTLDQNATELIHRWQYVAPNLPNDIYSTVLVQRANSSGPSNRTIRATFESMFLGRVDKLLELFEQRFPELGVKREDCMEVSWIQSVLFYAAYPVNVSSQVLTSRDPLIRPYSKGKSDYVQEPITNSGLKGIWELLYEEGTGRMLFISYGGRMSEISESALPFPHRAGNLYKIQYIVTWDEAGLEIAQRYTSWMSRLYRYMAPYVSKFPRAAYVNYRDLDLGVNDDDDNTSYARANIWGFKYYKNNFKRLVKVKTMVDPTNFFRSVQSIPPLRSEKRKNESESRSIKWYKADIIKGILFKVGISW